MSFHCYKNERLTYFNLPFSVMSNQRMYLGYPPAFLAFYKFLNHRFVRRGKTYSVISRIEYMKYTNSKK